MNQPPNGLTAVPEKAINESHAALSTGYAQSKHITERVLERACKIAGTPITIYSFGQIAGPASSQGVGGAWNKQGDSESDR